MKNSHFSTSLIYLLTLLLSWPAWTGAMDGGLESLRETGKAFASVARKVSPSVVYIQVEAEQKAHGRGQGPLPFGEDFFRRFFGDQFPGAPQTPSPRNEQPVTGQGSGFVFAAKDGLLSDATYILTNSHVVENAKKISVRFQDGREFEAKVRGSDPRSDVAVLEIAEGDLPALSPADSSSLEVGEWVIALGNPFGLSHTLTVGVVSAKGRTSIGLNDYEDFIQTDAAINPGNSGGPLVNLDGEVVGINTAIFSRSGGYMGVGFAIPINLARQIAEQLIEDGEVTRGYLGVVIQGLTPELAESFDLERSNGVLVAQVSDDSPASKAGLQQGDIIIAYRGEPVTEVGSFRNSVAMTAPGSREELTILREGKRKKIRITIGTLPDDGTLVSNESGSADALGLTVQTLTPELARQFNMKAAEGVVVTRVEPGSVAARAGMRAGMIILQVNHRDVKTVAEFRKALDKGSDEKRALLLVKQGNTQLYLVLNW